MTVRLLSHLSYADRNAALDAMRKVLACPHSDCDAQEPWTDAGGAVVKGWSFEDRIVNGSVVRVWFCREHAPPDPCPPLSLAPAQPRDPNAPANVFDYRFVRIHLGESAGTQAACVLREELDRLFVTGFRASSCRWSTPRWVPRAKIHGQLASNDKKVMTAVRHWPPPCLEKGKRR